MPLWQELPLLLVVAFCLAVLIRTFLLQAFFIPSGSMEDTLLDRRPGAGQQGRLRRARPAARRGGGLPGHRQLGAGESTRSRQPGFAGKLGRTLGDLVGVSRPGEKDFIKRVIGLPGDRVACCDDQGRVTVNGIRWTSRTCCENSPLDVPPNPQECRSRRFDEVVVPPGQIFVMGDHRLVSQDARCQGPVPIDNVIGRAFVVVWPSVALGIAAGAGDVRRRRRRRPAAAGRRCRRRYRPTPASGGVAADPPAVGRAARFSARSGRCASQPGDVGSVA